MFRVVSFYPRRLSETFTYPKSDIQSPVAYPRPTIFQQLTQIRLKPRSLSQTIFSLKRFYSSRLAEVKRRPNFKITFHINATKINFM